MLRAWQVPTSIPFTAEQLGLLRKNASLSKQATLISNGHAQILPISVMSSVTSHQPSTIWSGTNTYAQVRIPPA